MVTRFHIPSLDVAADLRRYVAESVEASERRVT